MWMCEDFKYIKVGALRNGSFSEKKESDDSDRTKR